MPLPIWLRWRGFVLINCWGILLVWTFRSLGKNLTDTVITRPAGATSVCREGFAVRYDSRQRRVRMLPAA